MSQFLEKLFPFDVERRNKQGVMYGETTRLEHKLWILNPVVHIDNLGVQSPVLESKYAWQPICRPNIELAPVKMLTVQCH